MVELGSQTVANLVDSFLLLSIEFAIAHSVFFKEVSNLIARR